MPTSDPRCARCGVQRDEACQATRQGHRHRHRRAACRFHFDATAQARSTNRKMSKKYSRKTVQQPDSYAVKKSE